MGHIAQITKTPIKFKSKKAMFKKLMELEETGRMFWHRIDKGIIEICVRPTSYTDETIWLDARNLENYFSRYLEDYAKPCPRSMVIKMRIRG